MKKTSFIWEIPTLDLEQTISQSTSWSSVAEHYSTHIGNIRTFQERAGKEGIDTSHFLGRSWSKGKRCPQNSHPKYSLDELLRKDGEHKITDEHLKNRLLRESDCLKEECYDCGIEPVWNNKPLRLHLSRLNNDKTDNRLENLILLCPNCKSQKKNRKFIKTPPCKFPEKEVFEREVTVIGIDGVGRKYGINSETVRKHLLEEN